MPEQRLRAGQAPTPERNTIRLAMTAWEETDNQFVLQSPITNLESATISLSDTATNDTYWFMGDDAGITSRISVDNTQITSLRSVYSNPSGNVHERQWLLDVHDIDDPYGTDVGRSAFVQVYNAKDAGNEGINSVNNRAMVLMRAKVNSGGQEAVAYVEASNSDQIFQVQGASKINLLAVPGGRVQVSGDFQPLGQPFATHTAGQHAFYSAGTDEDHLETVTTDVVLSTTAGTWTDVVELVGISCRLGRLYKVSFLGGHNLLTGGSGFATSDQWDMRIRRNTGSGYANIEEWRFARGRAEASRYPIPNRSVLFSPSATGTVSFLVQATKAAGAGTVTSELETNSSAADLRVLVEDVGWTSAAMN